LALTTYLSNGDSEIDTESLGMPKAFSLEVSLPIAKTRMAGISRRDRLSPEGFRLELPRTIQGVIQLAFGDDLYPRIASRHTRDLICPTDTSVFAENYLPDHNVLGLRAD